MNQDDAALIEELLLAQVPLERTIELFRGRVDEPDIQRVAEKLVSDQDFQSEVSLTGLVKSILERSKSASKDAGLMDTYISKLAEEVPEDFMDPIFMTIMKDPVVLSSGFVVDRDTVIERTTGRMKFHTCPFTRERLIEYVYPLVFLKKKLVHYKEQKIQPLLAAAAHLVENNQLNAFLKVQAAIKEFISSLGEAIYARYEKEVSELNLKAWEKAGPIDAKLWTPDMLADNFVRLYKSMPELWDNRQSEEIAKKKLELLDRISVLGKLAHEAIGNDELEEASAWCDACELVNHSCLRLKPFPVNRMRLTICKKHGGDIGGLRANVYLEIQSDASALEEFFKEEGLDHDEFECFAHLPIAIRVKCSVYVDSCTFAYPNGRVVNYGGSGGDHEVLIELEEGEMVVAVEGFQYYDPKYLGSFVRFSTSMKRDLLVQAGNCYNEPDEGDREYPDPNFRVSGGRETFPHPTLDGFYYCFRNNMGVFGLKTTIVNSSTEIIKGIITGEDHLEVERQLCLCDGEYKIRNARRGSLLCVNTGTCFEALISAEPDYENKREERWHLRGHLDGTYFICNDTHHWPLVCNKEAFEQNDNSYWALVSTTPISKSTSLEAFFYRSRGLWSIRREADASFSVKCDGLPLFCSEHASKEGLYRAKIHMDSAYADDAKERWIFDLISPLPQRTRSEVIAALFHDPTVFEGSPASFLEDDDLFFEDAGEWDEDSASSANY